MRISDWSSDVCSSDLGHLPPTVTAAAVMLCAGAVVLPAALIVDRPWTLRPSALSLGAAAALALFCTALALLLYFRLVRTLGSMGVASQAYLRSGVSAIGRASCRERGCQYV